MTNPAMPGLVKIGKSSRLPSKDWEKELSAATGVPYKFETQFEAMVLDEDAEEKKIHKILSKYRPTNKEFFRISVEAAVGRGLIFPWCQ